MKGTAAFFAGAVLLGAQQQARNPRADWPCGAHLDQSYFRVAEGSGGHLLLLAPEEIGDSATLLTAFGVHPQTILRLAGAVTPGLHEINVPIDPSVESALFSISVQCLQVADVVRPSGALAVGDDVSLLPNFRAQHIVIVKRPERGIWILRVAGSGISAVVVQAQSAIGITQMDFGRADSTTVAAVPAVGVDNALRIRISGHAVDVRASLVDGASQPLADLPLTAGDTEGFYVSRFSPGTEPFRVLVTGKDTDGFPLQRMTAPLITPMR